MLYQSANIKRTNLRLRRPALPLKAVSVCLSVCLSALTYPQTLSQVKSTELIPTQLLNKPYLHTRTQIFEELVTSLLTFLKKS